MVQSKTVALGWEAIADAASSMIGSRYLDDGPVGVCRGACAQMRHGVYSMHYVRQPHFIRDQ